MNQFKKQIAKAAFIIIVANSCPMAQGMINWNYWQNYVCDSTRSITQYVPKKLKQSKKWIAGGLAALVACVIYVKAKKAAPSQELKEKTSNLLDRKYSLRSVNGPWNIGGAAFVFRMSEDEKKERYDPIVRLDAGSGLLCIPEDIEALRIPLDQEEHVTPECLRKNKEYIIRFMSNYLKRIQSEQLSGYTKQLTEVVEQYEPKNILQGLLCSNADKELLEQLKYKKDQMEAFSEIVQEACGGDCCSQRAFGLALLSTT